MWLRKDLEIECPSLDEVVGRLTTQYPLRGWRRFLAGLRGGEVGINSLHPNAVSYQAKELSRHLATAREGFPSDFPVDAVHLCKYLERELVPDGLRIYNIFQGDGDGIHCRLFIGDKWAALTNYLHGPGLTSNVELALRIEGGENPGSTPPNALLSTIELLCFSEHASITDDREVAVTVEAGYLREALPLRYDPDDLFPDAHYLLDAPPTRNTALFGRILAGRGL